MMGKASIIRMLGLATLLGTAAAAVQAEDLYKGTSWSAMSADRKASARGDLLTVVIYQSVEAANSAQNSSSKDTQVGGSIRGGSLSEEGSLEFGGSYRGRGEVRRTEKLVAQITVGVTDILPNGDLVVGGEQSVKINGETTNVALRGRVRPEDVTSDNRVLSSRIADAQIRYDGQGFVSRSARPGIINRLFNFLGLL
ncbi:flagellar basal body L-ring protein FlgH [Allosphingosinicella deserti]|uniref:Flagellar L-ring protein n=1 Tax=Allosphingosinicella deserti TaxID=2116704 RepID=A0A2P7QW69_9SPHN|nr:flagellar basal body L-ring protein FlgH [Sphingomonas deserti]PSJ42212.1 flagellar biosynthesis protein FlgH [Sphingomonas deserti]